MRVREPSLKILENIYVSALGYAVWLFWVPEVKSEEGRIVNAQTDKKPLAPFECFILFIRRYYMSVRAFRISICPH